MEEESKEIHQLGFPPELGGEEEGEQKPTPRRRSTLRLRGSKGDYLPGVIPEKVNLRRLDQLRQALARILGKEITYQPELGGLEEKPEPEKENKT